MNYDEPSNELKDLVDRFLDGSISDDEMRQLDAILKPDESSAARAFFLQYCQMHIELGTDATVEQQAERAFDNFCERRERIATGAMGAAPAAPQSPRHFPFLSLGADFYDSVWQPALIFSAGIVVAAVCFGVWFQSRGDRPTEGNIAVRATDSGTVATSVDPRILPVAYLVSTNGCAFGGNSPRVQTVGSSVKLGDEITLHEGIADFRLSSGVSLSVEGPAALMLTSPTTMVLQHGKITMHVPWAASEFRVLAGDCRLTAREAEFGADVVRNSVEVHAFSGDVSVARSPFSAPSRLADDRDDILDLEPLTIRQGEAVAFVCDKFELKPPVQRKADRTRFATNLSMRGALPVPQQYIDLVLNQDSKLRPVSYWRFESLADQAVQNEIADAPPLKVWGELSLTGDAPNRSVEFRGPEVSGYLTSAGAIPKLNGPDCTVEVWAKPSHFHLGVLAGLTTGNFVSTAKEPVKFGIRLEFLQGVLSSHPGSLRFLHRNPPGLRGGSIYSNCLYALRRWQYLVGVKSGSSVCLYLDGQKVADAATRGLLARTPYLIVGRSFADLLEDCFVGQLDELAIYNRALSEDEIKRRFNIIHSAQCEAPDA
jgi:hypothetical protein